MLHNETVLVETLQEWHQKWLSTIGTNSGIGHKFSHIVLSIDEVAKLHEASLMPETRVGHVDIYDKLTTLEHVCQEKENVSGVKDTHLSCTERLVNAFHSFNTSSKKKGIVTIRCTCEVRTPQVDVLF